MADPDGRATTPAEVIAAAMRAQGLSKRRLAVLLHQADRSITIEGYRRNVYHWLAGTRPNNPSVERLARVLGVREEQLRGPTVREEQPRGPNDASITIEQLAASVRALEARMDKLEARLARASGSSQAA